MDTIGMDTYPLTAPVTGTATGGITQQDPALRPARAKATLAPGGFPPRRGQANDGENSLLMPACEHPFAAR